QFFVKKPKDDFSRSGHIRLIRSLLGQGCSLEKLKLFANNDMRPE
ncbi:12725_t:CDS:1, partial [Funneliformis mosseae]